MSWSEFPKDIRTREWAKFGFGDDSEVFVRTEGTAKTSGLGIAGRITEVELDDSSWTPLPATALTSRNAVAIQNQSAVEIKLNYDNSEMDYVGVAIPVNGERFYDITEDIILYGKSSSGSATIVIEEIS